MRYLLILIRDKSMLCSSIYFLFKVSFSSISVNYVLKKGLKLLCFQDTGHAPLKLCTEPAAPPAGGGRRKGKRVGRCRLCWSRGISWPNHLVTGNLFPQSD